MTHASEVRSQAASKRLMVLVALSPDALTHERRCAMTDQPDRIRTQSDPVATDMMCRECQHCGVDVITQRLWYPGGQCRNCGSYALSEVTS